MGDLPADDLERVVRLAAAGPVRLPSRPADATILAVPLVAAADGSSVLQSFLDDRADDR